ncbi:unnamed protein product, partial [Scytosiphon promiscuus]
DDSNGTRGRGGAGGAKASNASGTKSGRGKFQKASVDEACLEPAQRTLMAELSLSSARETNRPGTAAEPSMAPDRAPTAAEWLRAGVKRPRSAKTSVSRGVPFSADFSEEPRREGGDDGLASALPGRGEEPTESPGGVYTPEENAWDEERGCDSVDDDEHRDGRAGRRRRESNGKTEAAEEEEEAQLLKAGGLLGKRIQKTLRDVLKYDCSVGVAGNKFLAKLATNLAKPRGVCVLPRRDVSALLAATPATKIPGCGAGSAAAKQFAAWGAKTILDLRRVEAPEMRQRLGEQQGRKVFDRCRGIDTDPVEPDPIPSRVSSQLSLVPLISPAHCLGKPGEKLTPVFPWEVERVKPFLVTLVDDLVDRMKEEVAERHRRPTKLCIEHHLFQRGSKSQIFTLPARAAQRPRPRAPSTGPPTAGGAGDRHQHPDGTLAPKLVVGEETAETVGLLGLPSAASLVDLVLTPFKSYRNSRQVMAGSGGAQMERRKATEEGRAGVNPRSEHLPPVVKLIVSLLGFESVGPARPTAVPPGQQTLRGMMWLKEDDALSRTTAAWKHEAMSGARQNGCTSPPPSGMVVSERSSTAEIVAPSPVPDSVPVRSPSKCGMMRAQDAVGPLEKAKCKVVSGIGNTPPRAAEEGSVLVRCPSCKACLPVGKAWDAHREEHVLGGSAEGRNGPAGAQFNRTKSAPHRAEALLLPPSEAIPNEEITGEEEGLVGGSPTKLGGGHGSEDSVSSQDAKMLLARDTATRSGDCPGDRTRSRKLSELLMLAISSDQAADLLRQRGFLGKDGQTRFANV